MKKEDLLKAISSLLDNFKDETGSVVKGVEVAKSIDEEQKLFTAVVLRPDMVDAHGDIYDDVAVEKACHNYMEFCRKGNLQHLVQVEKAIPVESYIAKSDFPLGEGEVKKGDWVMTMKINDDDIWQGCKDGLFTGFSVGCKGEVEDLDD